MNPGVPISWGHTPVPVPHWMENEMAGQPGQGYKQVTERLGGQAGEERFPGTKRPRGQPRKKEEETNGCGRSFVGGWDMSTGKPKNLPGNLCSPDAWYGALAESSRRGRGARSYSPSSSSSLILPTSPHYLPLPASDSYICSLV